MTILTIPLIVCLGGLLIWFIFTKWAIDALVADVGRICFAVGLFWTLAGYAGR